MEDTINLSAVDEFRNFIGNMNLVQHKGRVSDVLGIIIESLGPNVPIGEYCRIRANGSGEIPCEVVGFKGDKTLLMPFGDMQGIAPGSEVISTGRPLSVMISDAIVGRVVDGLGRPIDGKGPVPGAMPVNVFAEPPAPLSRTRITKPLPLGIRAVDGLLTCGRGQRSPNRGNRR